MVKEISVSTRSRTELVDITSQVQRVVAESDATSDSAFVATRS